MKHRCPVCNKIVQGPTQEHAKEVLFFPFCSKRCKFIDLGAWLDSEYKLVSRLQTQDPDDSSERPSDDPPDKS